MALARPDLTALTDEERRQVASGFNEILESFGLPSQELNDWWNLVPFVELGGRTPTRAWLDGDYEVVRELIASLFEASSRAQATLAANPQFQRILADRKRPSD